MNKTILRHQLRIARDTLRLTNLGAALLGGMSKPQAIAFLLKHGSAKDKIAARAESEFVQ